MATIAPIFAKIDRAPRTGGPARRLPTCPKHRPLVRSTEYEADGALTERDRAEGEYIQVKRTSTTPIVDTTAVGQTRIGRLVFKPTPKPANESGDSRVALLALVDDLAMLAAELCFSGRIRRENRTGVIDNADKKNRDDI